MRVERDARREHDRQRGLQVHRGDVRILERPTRPRQPEHVEALHVERRQRRRRGRQMKVGPHEEPGHHGADGHRQRGRQGRARRAQQVCGSHVKRDAADAAQGELDRVRTRDRRAGRRHEQHEGERHDARVADGELTPRQPPPVRQHVDGDGQGRQRQRDVEDELDRGQRQRADASERLDQLEGEGERQHRERRARHRRQPGRDRQRGSGIWHRDARTYFGGDRSRRRRRKYTHCASAFMARVLFAHGHLLRFDRKQHAIGKPYPPLATITAAAYLRSLGHDVALYDPMLDDDTRGFAPALARARPEIVVIYDDVFNWFTKMCLGRMREAALGMIAAARAAGARVVVSGHDAADAPEVYLGAGADFVAVGEAEITLGELLAGYPTLDAPGGVPGLVFRDRGMVRRTGPRALLEGAGHAPDRGVGSRRRRSLPRVLARTPRLLLAERQHDARLPLQVQLVLEAGLRQHVSHAHARRRGRRDPPAARALRARSPLVLRRHLRAQGALADAVLRTDGERGAGASVPLPDARRPDDRRKRRGASTRRLRRDLAGRRVGRAERARRAWTRG